MSNEFNEVDTQPVLNYNPDFSSSEVASIWLASIIESADDAIITKSLEGIITSWNPGAERIFGYKSQEVIGRPVSILIPADYIDEEPNILARLRRGERIEHYETVRVRKDGEFIDISLTVSPIRATDGRIIGASKIARDITDRKRAEARLQTALNETEEARQEAENANAAKSLFLSRMSHELRTPLNAILGFSQILEMEGPDESQQESIEHISTAGQHLLNLINEVLDISRVESGNLEMSFEPTKIYQITRESVDLVRPLAAQQGIELNLDIADDETHILADRQRLKQVLLNLLANAVKYNRVGGRVTVSTEPVPDGRLRLKVVDTGMGISLEDQKKLFTPFERLNAEKHGIEGTGLGLALSRSLVKAMNGRLGLQSLENEGSTFYVELPLTAAPHLSRVSLNFDSEDELEGDLEKDFTILYIEDNISNYRLLEAILKRRPQIELLGAMQGTLGLDLARQHHPDLILLDLHLPDMMGHTVLRHLREDPTTGDIPVVVVSADATPKQIDRLLHPSEGHQGAQAYLTKPLDVRELLSKIDEYREKVPREAQLQTVA